MTITLSYPDNKYFLTPSQKHIHIYMRSKVWSRYRQHHENIVYTINIINAQPVADVFLSYYNNILFILFNFSIINARPFADVFLSFFLSFYLSFFLFLSHYNNILLVLFKFSIINAQPVGDVSLSYYNNILFLLFKVSIITTQTVADVFFFSIFVVVQMFNNQHTTCCRCMSFFLTTTGFCLFCSNVQ